VRSRNPRVALATVVAEGLLGRLAFGMVSFGLPLYAIALGLSVAEVGILISLRTVFVLPLKPAAGWLSDRIGVRAVYMLGAFCRVAAAAILLAAGGFLGLLLVRLLQGASAAGRDVASLGVIAREAQARVGTVYSWYSSAKHVGGVAGAALAGLIIAAAGYQTLFLTVLALSVLPTAAAWLGLREVSDEEVARKSAPEDLEGSAEAREDVPVKGGTLSLLRELGGPASVGMLVAASAYMVHGLFPILATEYAGLSEVQAGAIYSLSAAVFLVSGPVFGMLVDRKGRLIGIAWRSAANIGSSVLYLISPTFLGFAAARSVDDSGKAAFRPAWASAVAEIAARDPRRSGRRLGALDTSQTAGEALGPALAGLLWQTGGVFALFGARIVIAAVAEIAALRVFGELRGRRLAGMKLVTACLIPPVLGLAAAGALWLEDLASREEIEIATGELVLGGALVLLGAAAGALAGGAVLAAELRTLERSCTERVRNLAHDLRGPVTVIRGEVELVLSREDTPPEERRRSAEAVVEEVERIEGLLQPPNRPSEER
jgi:MFS family permease